MKVEERFSIDYDLFDEFESNVRSYSRSFPTVFTKAQNYRMWDAKGRPYIDFFAGAGALNYGHNHPAMKKALIRYLEEDGVIHSLDMSTKAKGNFLKTFQELILQSRNLTYKVMFPGPTGTNAVESALKLARKITGRQLAISFTNAFHGMTLGSLSLTGNAFKRSGAGVALGEVAHMPYDGYFGPDLDTLEYLETLIRDEGSGVDMPAAVIVETVQGEGGIHAAGQEWLRGLEQICRENDMLLIVDDVQVGCGRTGPFFSFEQAGIEPDIVCLSKSISGYGLPMALTLIKPEYDIFQPGEHNGTFRGNNAAFVTAEEALQHFWRDDHLPAQTLQKGEKIARKLRDIAETYPSLRAEVRGRGMIRGLHCPEEGLAEAICREAFAQGLLVETSGPRNEVVKILPPLVIDDAGLEEGLDILERSVHQVLHHRQHA